MANGIRGCEWGRANRMMIQTIQEGQKRTHERIDTLVTAVYTTAGGIVVAIVSIWLTHAMGANQAASIASQTLGH